MANHSKLPWLYLTVLKTNAVNFHIDKYPKVFPFGEITPSKSHRNYWPKKKNARMDCTVNIDEGHGNL